ncbi:hypothetical protein ACQHME_24275, partial [Escherichia coli]|uniref:hypothetical protein n=1 Tax=Escherichia coli TaxID=562 RepID=UPI003CF804C4
PIPRARKPCDTLAVFTNGCAEAQSCGKRTDCQSESSYAIAAAPSASPALVQDPSRTLIERGWLFHEGDVIAPPPEGHNATYLSVKAGN